MARQGQQFMQILLFFDLPMVTREEKRDYMRFRKFLLQDGYAMLQFSIYARLCNGLENAQKHLARLPPHLPPAGSVRTLCITDKQYGKMAMWLGTPTEQEKSVKPQQLLLF